MRHRLAVAIVCWISLSFPTLGNGAESDEGQPENADAAVTEVGTATGPLRTLLALRASLPDSIDGGEKASLAAQLEEIEHAMAALPAADLEADPATVLAAIDAGLVRIDLVALGKDKERLIESVAQVARWLDAPILRDHGHAVVLRAKWHERVGSLLGRGGIRERMRDAGYGDLNSKEPYRSAVSLLAPVIALEEIDPEATVVYARCAWPLILGDELLTRDERMELAVDVSGELRAAWSLSLDAPAAGVLRQPPIRQRVAEQLALALGLQAELEAAFGFEAAVERTIATLREVAEEWRANGIELGVMAGSDAWWRAGVASERVAEAQAAADGEPGVQRAWFDAMETAVDALRRSNGYAFFHEDVLLSALNQTAWFYLTSTDPALRMPERALELASECIAGLRSVDRSSSGGVDPEYARKKNLRQAITLANSLDTLALAQAEVGDVVAAVATQEEAIQAMTEADAEAKDLAEFRERLARYQAESVPRAPQTDESRPLSAWLPDTASVRIHLPDLDRTRQRWSAGPYPRMLDVWDVSSEGVAKALRLPPEILACVREAEVVAYPIAGRALRWQAAMRLADDTTALDRALGPGTQVGDAVRWDLDGVRLWRLGAIWTAVWSDADLPVARPRHAAIAAASDGEADAALVIDGSRLVQNLGITASPLLEGTWRIAGRLDEHGVALESRSAPADVEQPGRSAGALLEGIPADAWAVGAYVLAPRSNQAWLDQRRGRTDYDWSWEKQLRALAFPSPDEIAAAIDGTALAMIRPGDAGPIVAIRLPMERAMVDRLLRLWRWHTGYEVGDLGETQATWHGVPVAVGWDGIALGITNHPGGLAAAWAGEAGFDRCAEARAALAALGDEPCQGLVIARSGEIWSRAVAAAVAATGEEKFGAMGRLVAESQSPCWLGLSNTPDGRIVRSAGLEGGPVVGLAAMAWFASLTYPRRGEGPIFIDDSRSMLEQFWKQHGDDWRYFLRPHHSRGAAGTIDGGPGYHMALQYTTPPSPVVEDLEVLEFSPDGDTLLVSAGPHAWIKAIKPVDGSVAWTMPPPPDVDSICFMRFTPDRRRLVTISVGRRGVQILVMDATSRAVTSRTDFAGDSWASWGMWPGSAVDLDDRHLAFFCDRPGGKIHERMHLALVPLDGTPASVVAVSAHPDFVIEPSNVSWMLALGLAKDSIYAVMNGREQRLLTWRRSDLEAETSAFALSPTPGVTYSQTVAHSAIAARAPGGPVVASWVNPCFEENDPRDVGIHCWSIIDRKSTFSSPAKPGEQRASLLTEDGRTLVVAGMRTDVSVYDLDDGSTIYSGPLRTKVTAVALSRDRRWLAVAMSGGALRFTDLVNGGENIIGGDIPCPGSLASLPDGSIALGYVSGAIRRWSTSGEPIQVLIGHRGEVNDLDVATDGRLASAGTDGTVRIWDLGEGREVWQHAIEADPEAGSDFDRLLLSYGRRDVTHVRWLDDGRLMWVEDGAGVWPVVFDLADHSSLRVREGRLGMVGRMYDGKPHVLSCGQVEDAIVADDGGDLSVWDLSDGEFIGDWSTYPRAKNDVTERIRTVASAWIRSQTHERRLTIDGATVELGMAKDGARCVVSRFHAPSAIAAFHELSDGDIVVLTEDGGLLRYSMKD